MLYGHTFQDLQIGGIVVKFNSFHYLSIHMAGVVVAGHPCPRCHQKDYDYGLFRFRAYRSNPRKESHAQPYAEYRACFKCLQGIMPRSYSGALINTDPQTRGRLTLAETGHMTLCPSREDMMTNTTILAPSVAPTRSIWRRVWSALTRFFK